MGCTYIIENLLKITGIKNHIVDTCEIEKIKSPNALIILQHLEKILPNIERFRKDENLDKWMLEIDLTDDEGVEFIIVHTNLDVIAFLIEDDRKYSHDEVLGYFGLESIYLPEYEEFLTDANLVNALLREVEIWGEDSEYHPLAILHLKAVLEKGFELASFGGNPETKVELTFDEEEIFIGCVDADEMVDNPDYHLTHDQFDPSNADQSIEIGIQSWSELDEEDDDWSDVDDDLEDLSDDEEDDWDSEDDSQEWDPGFEEDED